MVACEVAGATVTVAIPFWSVIAVQGLAVQPSVAVPLCTAKVTSTFAAGVVPLPATTCTVMGTGTPWLRFVPLGAVTIRTASEPCAS